MKIKIKSYNAVASWRWNTQINKPGTADQQEQQQEDEEDEEDDVCGICQVAFEGCCPNCKVPGDDCPLSEWKHTKENACACKRWRRALILDCLMLAVFGECTHIVRITTLNGSLSSPS